MDIDKGVATIMEGMGLEAEAPAEAPVDTPAETPETPETPQAEAAPEAPVAAPVTRAAPKSWAKEQHEAWGRLEPTVQDYIELREKQMLDGLSQYREHSDLGRQINEAATPYMQMLQQYGVSPAQAFSSLLAAQARLMSGSPEQRMAAYQQLGQQLGFVAGGPAENAQLVAVQQQVQELQSALRQREQRQIQEHHAKISAEVDEFAKAHEDFEIVSADMIPFLQAGQSLQEAYDKAMWANPATRAKAQAALQKETEEKLREKGRKEAEEAQKAKAVNVKSRDTRKAPTEPLGKMDDTLKETLREINSRTH